METSFNYPRDLPAMGPKMRLTRDPAYRVRQAVRDNNVPLLSRLQYKTDLRNTDKNRLTSLSWAVIDGSLEVFEWLLLDYGHDDQELSRDTDSNTILHLLASVPSPPTLSPHVHLLRASPLFPPRRSTRSLAEQITICLRMTNLYYTLFPFLLDWSNSGGKTALHVAAQAGNTAFIALLCDFGADVNLTDLQGNTPLHYASAWGHVETIRVLLDRGAGYNNRNYEGFTASDFAYSHTVMNALQTIAREVYEERRSKRKRESSRTETRFRSGSVSTNLSTGSGSAVSSNIAQSSDSSGMARSVPMINSHSQSFSGMGIPTSAGRPITSRSPSVPVSHSGSPTPPVPEIPPSFGMRRANSAQTWDSGGEVMSRDNSEMRRRQMESRI